ncbi:MAG: riboflavin biosynthesis protein RibD [Lysobacteraceae bacterium]|nr:MAG: riboflavin biosynthesis protein RibD [Xanthomonadaceae bacterium]
MLRAIELAARATNTTHPNPRVGCVLVHNETVVGEGYHQAFGGPHAEVEALAQAGDAAKGADCYVSLEPCSHTGKTPPCADALIAAGVRRVVAATVDPNPQVAGSGLDRLRQAGITVECGLLESEARAVSPGFFSHIERQRPFVRLKLAISLDGRIARSDGVSQWITGSEAREEGHRWRARSDLIVTGAGTVRHDDPSLTVRLSGAQYKQPQRMVLTRSRGDLPADSRLLQKGERTLVANAVDDDAWSLPTADKDRVDLPALMGRVSEQGFREVHVEAGGVLAGSLLEQGLVDELLLFQAPVLLGEHGLPMLQLGSERSLELAPRLTEVERKQCGVDWFVRYRV